MVCLGDLFVGVGNFRVVMPALKIRYANCRSVRRSTVVLCIPDAQVEAYIGKKQPGLQFKTWRAWKLAANGKDRVLEGKFSFDVSGSMSDGGGSAISKSFSSSVGLSNQVVKIHQNGWL